jgi:3D (Asp-Asp-Asp) domain-containing protein
VRYERIAGLILGLSLFNLVGAGAPPVNGTYVATAYCQSGVTASGLPTTRHIVAADPDVLPIGSRIKIKHAGRFSGEYVVADTGRNIQGRRLDIYMPREGSCVRFGRKRVKVRVIQVGDGTKRATAIAVHEVKKDVQNELSRKAVGGAATEEDWAAKKRQDPTSDTSLADLESRPQPTNGPQ